MAREGRRPPVVRLPGGITARPHSVKCYRPGCRRRKAGYLGANGAFYDRMGHLLADLREKEFACDEHGIAGAGGSFLIEDK